MSLLKNIYSLFGSEASQLKHKQNKPTLYQGEVPSHRLHNWAFWRIREKVDSLLKKPNEILEKYI